MSAAAPTVSIATLLWSWWIISSSGGSDHGALLHQQRSTDNSGTYGIPASDPAATATDRRVQSLLGAYTLIFTERRE